jgi:hypothetical protein
MNTRPAVLVSMALAAVVACAQNTNYSRRFDSPRFVPRAKTGAPYSAEQVSESEQTLADGTHIRHTSQATKMYRDSEGRTRVDRPVFGERESPAGQESPILVEINDPVAHARIILDTVNRIAHRQEMPAPGELAHSSAAASGGGAAAVAQRAKASRAPDSSAPEQTTETLGTQTLEGLEVQGTRHTITWPAGSTRGNDRPITQVSEIWTSRELSITVLNRVTDPTMGERTVRLTNISRDEPDAALFQPPSDYTVVDETGEFTIQWGR